MNRDGFPIGSPKVEVKVEPEERSGAQGHCEVLECFRTVPSGDD